LEKLAPTFEDKGCHVVSVTDLYGRILGFQDRSRYFLFQILRNIRIFVETATVTEYGKLMYNL
jgi:hypothetical protein